MKKLVVILGIIIAIFSTSAVMAARNLKKTVAVFKFENDSGYHCWRHMGQDFSDQLTDIGYNKSDHKSDHREILRESTRKKMFCVFSCKF